MQDDLLLLPKLESSFGNKSKLSCIPMEQAIIGNYSVYEHDFESPWLWEQQQHSAKTMKRRTCLYRTRSQATAFYSYEESYTFTQLST